MANDSVETRIDRAWTEAQAADVRNDAAADAAAAHFMDVLLAEALICPVLEGPDGSMEGFSPKLTDLHGRDTLTLFDAEERLAAFMGAPTAFVAMPGRRFFELAASKTLPVALNPNVAPSSMILSAEAVTAMGAVATSGEEIVVDTSGLSMAAPLAAPEALLVALSRRIEAARADIAEAWLVALIEGAGEEAAAGRLALVLRPDEALAMEDLRALAEELAQLGASHLTDGATLDVSIARLRDPLLKMARNWGVGFLEGGAAAAAVG